MDNKDGRPVLVDTLAAAAAIARPSGTVRRWAHEGKLTRLGADEKGRALYDLAAVYALASGVQRKRPGVHVDKTLGDTEH